EVVELGGGDALVGQVQGGSGQVVVVIDRRAALGAQQAELGAGRRRHAGRFESFDLFLHRRGSVADGFDFEEHVLDVGRQAQDVAVSESEGLAACVVGAA